MYNYLDSMKDDVLQAIRDNYSAADYEDREEFEETLNEDLWLDDSVTGNGSGSYTFSREAARGYVIDNMDILGEMIREFDIDAETIARHFIEEDWEYFDVSIRCYLLGQAIAAALDDIEEAAAAADPAPAA